MYGLRIEHRKLHDGTTLSRDLAEQIYSKVAEGEIAVVTDKPAGLLSAVRKQWFKLIRQTQREQSSTLDSARRQSLAQRITYMQSIKFTAKQPIKDPVANVCFASAEQFIFAPPICSTLYLTAEISKRELYLLASWMPPQGVVIIYEQEAKY